MKFSIKEMIINAWGIMKNHLALWIFIMLLVFGLNLFISGIQDGLLEIITYQAILFSIAAYLFQMGLNLGMLRIALNIIKTNKSTFKELFGSFHMLIPFILATIVFLVLILLASSPGIILLLVSISSEPDSLSALDGLNGVGMFLSILLIIVPAIYISIRLQYYDYFLIDDECSILESIKKSAKITKGYIGELFILGATLSIIVLISIIPLGVGLIISIPLGIMVNTLMYQKLKQCP